MRKLLYICWFVVALIHTMHIYSYKCTEAFAQDDPGSNVSRTGTRTCVLFNQLQLSLDELMLDYDAETAFSMTPFSKEGDLGFASGIDEETYCDWLLLDGQVIGAIRKSASTVRDFNEIVNYFSESHEPLLSQLPTEHRIRLEAYQNKAESADQVDYRAWHVDCIDAWCIFSFYPDQNMLEVSLIEYEYIEQWMSEMKEWLAAYETSLEDM